MTPYLQRLLSLIDSAAQKSPYGDLPVSEESDEGKLRLVSPAYIRLDELLGVPAEMFPSALRLSDEHLHVFTAALLRLWRAFRLYPDFPEHLPSRRRYELLVGRMGGLAVPCFGAQGTYIEFCWYEPADCPFGSEFCECKNWVRDREAVYECGSVGVWECLREGVVLRHSHTPTLKHSFFS